MDKNTNRPRTIDEIYLRPERNMQGVHELMDFQTFRVIVRSRVTEIPVTELIIKSVEQMAVDQGINALKFYNRKRKNTDFHDADLEGVDDYSLNDISDGENESFIENDADDILRDMELEEIDGLLDEIQASSPNHHHNHDT